MNDPLQQLKERSKGLRLDPGRKAAMRSLLVRFMDAHEAVAIRPASVPFSMLLKRFAPAGVALLIILAGGGTSLAADSALPGDPLYTIKLKVNEPILAAFQASPAAKAEWHAHVAVRRLEEADQLAIEGRLDAAAKAELETHFEGSASKAAAAVAELNAKGDAEAASNVAVNLESDLNAHARILADLDAKDEPAIAAIETLRATVVAEPRPESSLIRKIRSALVEVKKARGEAEVKVAANASAPDVSRAASNKIDAAGRAIENVMVFVGKNSGKLAAEASADALARLGQADVLYAEAKASLEAGEYGEAFRLANRAERAAQETRVLAGAQLQADTQAGLSGRDAATAAPAALNFLTVQNPQADDDDSVIMGSAGDGAAAGASGTATSTLSPGGGMSGPNPNLNVDGTSELNR